MMELDEGQQQKMGPPLWCGFAILLANAVVTFLTAFGIGLGGLPPRGLEPGFIDIPVSMLWIVFVMSAPGPCAAWLVFDLRGLGKFGAALALIAFLAFFGMMREATMMVP